MLHCPLHFCCLHRSGAVVSLVTGTGVAGAGGGVTRQTPAQITTMMTRVQAHGVNALRVYDAVGSGAVTLQRANTYSMMGTRAWRRQRALACARLEALVLGCFA